MTTVNNIADILRIIREQPEWGEALRAALLSKELLEMPQTLAEFAQVTNRRLGSLEGDVSELKAGQARLEVDVAELKVGQARLEGDVAELKAGQARLEGDVAALKDGQARLEGDVAGLQVGQGRLEGGVGNLQGNAYEQRVANNISSIVRQHLGVRRVRVLKGFKTPDEMTFHNMIDEAGDQGVISERERVEVGNSDIVLQGYSQQAITYLALEVSLTVGESDINRAADRADILSRATGKSAVPAVISAHLDDGRRQLAVSRNVALITVAE